MLLLAQTFQDRIDMNLVGLVVAGQRIHHQIDAEPEGDFPLQIGAGYHRK